MMQPDFPGGILLRAAMAPLTAIMPASICANQAADSDGYHLEASYMGEAWYAASGGLATGSAYLDNLDLGMTIDGEQLFNIPSFTMFASALYNNGGSISGHLVGDAQGVSSIETVKALRLFQFWGDWTVGSKANHSLLFGLYDLNSEFDVIPTAGLFVGAAHGMGSEFAQTGRQGPSAFPVSSLAFRYRWQMDQNWRLQAAVLDGVPGDTDHPNRNSIHISSGDGALLTTEIGYQAARKPKVALGVWHYTAAFDDLSEVDESGEPVSTSNNIGAYLLADIPLLGASEIAVDAAKLSAFLRFGIANGNINRFDQYFGAGLVWRDAIIPGGGDALGLAISHARNGKAWRRNLDQMGVATDSHETIIELSWQVAANDWLTLQPNVQYVLNPNTDPGLSNAFVMGLRFEMAFENIW